MPKKHKKTARELTDDELLDRYCFYLDELSTSTKTRDVFGVSNAQVNLRLLYQELSNRNLTFSQTQQRN